MPRPSQNLDRKLIEAGKAVLAEKGFSGLTLRAVAGRAKVNLGMFQYHFKGKEDFSQKVAQAFYEEFLASLTLVAQGKEPPALRLRQTLLHLARFTRDHRPLLLSLLTDAGRGDPGALRFIKKNFRRHGLLLLGLITECRRKGVLKPLPLGMLVPLLASAVAGPNLMLGFAERIGHHSAMAKMVATLIKKELEPEARIVQRIDLVLEAVAGQGRKGRER